MDDMGFDFGGYRQELTTRLEDLEQRHRQLDSQVAELHAQGADMIRIQRLKREKLALKDEISRIRSQLCPNIIA